MGGIANPLWNPWANDGRLLELYGRRCRQEAEEMTCAAQAAEILGDRIGPGETLLDAGCGGGYYFWSFRKRNVPVEYHGLDYTPQMIEMARTEISLRAPLPPERFILGSIEDLERPFDNIICFNVLTNSPHYALPLGCLLACARKRILIRESLGDSLVIRYTPDPYLDESKRYVRVYHNTYPIKEVISFIEEHGFRVTQIRDQRTQDGVELFCDVPLLWRILLGERVH